MPSLDSRYPDLLPAPHDSALHQIVSRLDRAYGPENPNVGPPPEWRAHLAMILARRAGETAPRKARLRWFLVHPWRNTAFALVFAVAALGAAILGLALTDTPHYDTPNPPPPAYMVRALNLYGHTANQSWRDCGYTISVIRTYGDANRVIVEWSIQGPSDPSFAQLEGTSGLVATGLNPATGQRVRLQPMDGWIGGMTHNTTTMYDTFDTHQIAHEAAALHLQLHLASFNVMEQPGSGVPTASGCERYSGEGGLPSLSIGSLQDAARGFLTRWKPSLFPQSAYTAAVDGVTMSLTVAMDPVRVETHPEQKVTARGVALILDHVIATRSEVRVYLRRAKPGHILEDSWLTLFTGDSSGGAWTLFNDYWTRVAPASRLYDFAFPNLHYMPHASFTLAVQRDPYEGTPSPSWRTLKGGPWTFHFTLP